MIGKCENCGQSKNLIKGLCNICYHRQINRNQAKLRRSKALSCVRCNTLLRNKDYKLCTHCRTEMRIIKEKLQTLPKKIAKTQENINICKLVEQGKGFQELGKEKGVTKQAIFNIANKGLKYYEQKLNDYTAEFYRLSIIEKELETFID